MKSIYLQSSKAAVTAVLR